LLRRGLKPATGNRHVSFVIAPPEPINRRGLPFLEGVDPAIPNWFVKSLSGWFVTGTLVTDAGIEELKRALPSGVEFSAR